ncbi:hypothetical protein L2E82_45756 [Cichorium intybus]|uniref:Uncharacterized protein n=1 Tax=Cichorium intybus TaxID=13427 RepID=A0ACB8ZU81_CICIN|nr:hypothetical protein L2E82_45756 [Cichorium intybus]
MTKKVVDVDNDLTQFKTETTDRIDKLEASIEKRHAGPHPLPPQSSIPISTPTMEFPKPQSGPLMFDDLGFPMTLGNDRGSSSQGGFFRPGNQGGHQLGSMFFWHADSGILSPTSGYGRGSGPSGERLWLPGTYYRLRKLKMPLFDGEDAFG